MPDFVTHLAVSALAYHLAGSDDFRPFVIGSILPDLPRFTRLLLFKLTKGDYPRTEMYLEAMHTPAALLLAGAACAVLSDRPFFVFFAVFGTAVLHLLLDCFQTIPGRYPPLLFPFSRYRIAPPIINPDSPYTIAVAFLVIPWVLWTISNSGISVTLFSLTYLPLALVLISLWYILPIISVHHVFPIPDSELAFIMDIRKSESVSLVEATVVNPSLSIVERLGKRFCVRSDNSLPMKGKITLSGSFDGVSFHISSWRIVPYRAKMILSIIGGILAAAVFLREFM